MLYRAADYDERGSSIERIKEIRYSTKLGIVFTVVVVCIIPASAIPTDSLVLTTNQLSDPVAQPAIHKTLPRSVNLGTDVLVSADNPDLKDETPHATMNSQGVIVLTYEKEIDPLIRRIPVVYSNDNGASWVEQFELDSTGISGGSDYLQSPDIKYCPVTDQFFVHMIDPLADLYNEVLWWIDGDIANDPEADGYGVGVAGSLDYTEGACTYVGKWFLDFSIHNSAGFTGCPNLGYFWWDGVNNPKNPVDVNSSWAAGFYYDEQSVLKTSVASQPEMATGNNVYMVMQSFNGVYSNISFKATVTDLDPYSPTFLFTSGGGPAGMDEYADIEVWPIKQFYLAVDAADPDVGAKGNVVSVVFVQAGNVMCRTSLDAGVTWADTTTIAAGGYPAVFVAEGAIYVVYVSNGNLFYKKSTDNGATWGAAIQINDVAGTVVAKEGTVDIGPGGFVWTDNRDGVNDIYHEYMEYQDHPPILEITTIKGGIGISATIKNIGCGPATDVSWTIKVIGGILGGINVEETGIAAILTSGAEIGRRTRLILGFGMISVQVTASCDEDSVASLLKIGKQLLFFSIIK